MLLLTIATFYSCTKEIINDSDIQELEIYCSPSLGTPRQHARFNNLSKVVYSFKHNKKVFDKVVKDNIKINKIKGGDVASYHKSLVVSFLELFS